MTLIYSIILAGGTGSRLWPLSRFMYPKQMFKLDDEYTLFQQTFLKLTNFIDDKNIVTATNIKYAASLKEQLKQLQDKFCRKSQYKIITEPTFRNTAPSLALAVKYIKEKINYSSSDPIILSVPSDQLITNREMFSELILKGVNLAKEGYIVAFGTETNKVNENFGYMKARTNSKISQIEPKALKVSGFIEKPSTKEAKAGLKGKFYINSGIYMFSISVFFNELKKNAPEIYKIITENNITDTIPSMPLNIYEQFPNISIDYAIMEKSKKMAIIPLSTEWKDIGSWDAIYDVSKKDKNGNFFFGNVIDYNSENSMIYSTSKLTTSMGLKDTIVITTEDAILVCDKNNINGIKRIYKKLNGKNSATKEIHKTVYRPWGYYTVLEDGQGFLTKCITVNPNAKLSLQLHNHRSEHWIILEGEATVIKGKETISLKSGESIDIGVREIHSLQNFGKEQLKVLEIQQGDILDENDIERLEDMYGRV